ncbi:MAG: hypothetical protein NTZ19_06380 [Bacteroidetes bacterium]|nr:hypothetical protein [Bacteroidota bacterium]
MKKILSFLVAICITVASFAQATEQQLSEKVKVVFPGKPEATDLPNGPKVFSYKKDSSVAFMGMAFDLSPMGLTEEVIAAAGDGLWDQIKGGMMGQMAGANLTKDEVVQFKGKSALYLEIDGKESTAPQLQGKKAFGYLFFSGAILHQILYYSSDPAAKKEDATAFFESVVISK